jgi:hypothetical protein
MIERMITNIRRKIAVWLYPNLSGLISMNKSLVEQLKIERRQREDVDPKNIMRQLIGLSSIDMEAMEDLYIGLSLAEIRSFHKWGFDLAMNKWWKHIRSNSINRQAAKTLKEMLIDERHAWIGGGTINGIMFIDEQVERLRAAHEEDIVPEEPFDNSKLIQE